MNTRRSTPLPVALRTASRQFDRWRSRQRKRARLPADLWQKAVALAREHGLNKTATALGLKYESLKKHIEAAGAPEGFDSATFARSRERAGVNRPCRSGHRPMAGSNPSS